MAQGFLSQGSEDDNGTGWSRRLHERSGHADGGWDGDGRAQPQLHCATDTRLVRIVYAEMTRHDLSDFDLEAEVTHLPTAEGGRKTPARSGYRPTCDFGVPGVLNDGAHFFVGKTWVAPGESVLTRIQLISPESLQGRLHVGQSFAVREGMRITARAIILRLHNESLAIPSDDQGSR